MECFDNRHVEIYKANIAKKVLDTIALPADMEYPAVIVYIDKCKVTKQEIKLLSKLMDLTKGDHILCIYRDNVLLRIGKIDISNNSNYLNIMDLFADAKIMEFKSEKDVIDISRDVLISRIRIK